MTSYEFKSWASRYPDTLVRIRGDSHVDLVHCRLHPERRSVYVRGPTRIQDGDVLRDAAGRVWRVSEAQEWPRYSAATITRA